METGGSTRNDAKDNNKEYSGVGKKRGKEKTETTNRGIGRGGGGGGSGGLVKLFYTNAQSVRNKINVLKAQIEESKPQIIAITESWTHKDMVESELNLDGYEIINRKDREDTVDGRGGGVLLYSNLTNISTTKLQTNFHQILAVKLTYRNEVDVNLHLVYRSPNSSDSNNDSLLTHISTLPENTVLLGDFNCRDCV